MQATLQKYEQDEQPRDGITQQEIASMANVSIYKANRYITSNDLKQIAGGNHRYMRYSIEDARAAIQTLMEDKKPILRKKHAFYNFKGGTGKTSLCYQVATHIAFMGYKVLAIDADPQAHLSVSLGFRNDDNLTLYDIIVCNQNPRNVIRNVFPGLDCIPSNLSLTRLETELSHMTKREERLALDLKELEKQYDFIFIDTNPTISILNRNIVNYADILEIVCETQPYSLNGLKLLMEDLHRFYAQMHMSPKQVNIIPNKYEDRTTNSAEAMTVLRTYYSESLKPDFAIRRSEDMITSSKLCKPLAFFAKKNSIALQDVLDMCHHIKDISTR